MENEKINIQITPRQKDILDNLLELEILAIEKGYSDHDNEAGEEAVKELGEIMQVLGDARK